MNLSHVQQFVDQYLEHYQNYKEAWNYEDGCVLIGCMKLYQVKKEERYKEFIIRYMDQFVMPDGTIRSFGADKYNIDSINSGKVLFFLYETTGEEKYRLAIDTVMEQLKTHPRTRCGNFWHKNIYPNQIWLDGLYMAQSFYMEYATKYNHKEGYNDILNQFENVRKYLYNNEKGLYYHAYDETRVQHWADKTTGLSPNFWLRSMGWYLMALVDTIDAMSMEIYEQYRTLADIFKEAIKGILRYQDKHRKLFYQVIDKSDIEGNYLETSGSAMIAYSILKGCRLGLLQKEKYLTVGVEIFEQLVEQKLIITEDKIQLCDICSVAGLGPGEQRDGSIAYYLSEKIVCDDPKGVGAFIMAYAEWLML